MKHALALLAGLSLMACAPPDKPAEPGTTAAPPPVTTPAATPAPPTETAQTPPPGADAGDDKCNKAKYAALVGQPATAAGVPPPSKDVRHIHPDTQVTMDFRPDRLNIYINADGVITELRCT